MKVLSIVGATLLVTSFHAAAFVSVSPVPAGQNANVSPAANNGHAIPSEAVNADITKIIPIAGCHCAFCNSLRAANLCPLLQAWVYQHSGPESAPDVP
ncbi:hypothetical protein [Klebsiella pneumoniae]|uniref:hypothetical protein n=1 Tax=Klebsiella pneumoniae TaxID=573 RepID=UPI00295F4648|nr:hypothetical protein [Klebsiella pneumoniae]WOU80588.1 hypothetical protein R5O54_03375 [Klebsiella pneumoniae]